MSLSEKGINFVSSIPSAITFPETNIAPENRWLGDYFPFGKACFQVLP